MEHSTREHYDIDPKLLATFGRMLCWKGEREYERGVPAEHAVRRVWKRNVNKSPWLADYPQLLDQLKEHLSALSWNEWDDEETTLIQHSGSRAA